MSFKIPQIIRKKMHKAYQIAREHSEFTAEIDNWFEQQGIDVNRMRVWDAADYVDCIDYGQATVDDVEKSINENWEWFKKEQSK